MFYESAIFKMYAGAMIYSLLSIKTQNMALIRRTMIRVCVKMTGRVEMASKLSPNSLETLDLTWKDGTSLYVDTVS